MSQSLLSIKLSICQSLLQRKGDQCLDVVRLVAEEIGWETMKRSLVRQILIMNELYNVKFKSFKTIESNINKKLNIVDFQDVGSCSNSHNQLTPCTNIMTAKKKNNIISMMPVANGHNKTSIIFSRGTKYFSKKGTLCGQFPLSMVK